MLPRSVAESQEAPAHTSSWCDVNPLSAWLGIELHYSMPANEIPVSSAISFFHVVMSLIVN